jgi:putative ABC transport system permease protein
VANSWSSPSSNAAARSGCATLGATKGHIRTQFLSEAILLALAGGIVGIGIGALATTIYAHAKGWATVIPTDA